MGNVNRVDITLEGKNRARLRAKDYDKDYTPIPNSALPSNMKNTLNSVFRNLSGSDLPEDSFTFMVRSQDGKFKRVYSPSVYRNTDSNCLAIKWGDSVIDLSIKDGVIGCPTAGKNKLKFKLYSESFGKFSKTCINVTYSENGDLFTMSFPIRSLELKDPLDVNELEFLLESDPESLMGRVSELSTGSNSVDDGGYKGSPGKLKGDFVVKASSLPLGVYTVTGFRRYSNTYGNQHLLQVEAPETPFDSITRVKNDDGDWVDQEVTINSAFIVKANGKLNEALMSDPIISEDSPATLEILEKFEFNGYPACKVELKPVSYTVDDTLFSVDF